MAVPWLPSSQHTWICTVENWGVATGGFGAVLRVRMQSFEGPRGCPGSRGTEGDSLVTGPRKALKVARALRPGAGAGQGLLSLYFERSASPGLPFPRVPGEVWGRGHVQVQVLLSPALHGEYQRGYRVKAAPAPHPPGLRPIFLPGQPQCATSPGEPQTGALREGM